MRKLESKYEGSCTKCSKAFEVGTLIFYEKTTGVFCIGCEPTEIEEIRAFRQARIDRKNERREVWAQAREQRAERLQTQSDTLMRRGPDGRADWALVTQPGHIPQRATANRMQEKAWEEQSAAAAHRAKKLSGATVAGDAERAREEKREAARAWVKTGMVVNSIMWGNGTVKRISKKTVTMDRGDGRLVKEWLHWIKQVSNIMSAA